MGQEALCVSVFLWWILRHSVACSTAHKLVKKMSFEDLAECPWIWPTTVLPCSEILSYCSGKNYYVQLYCVPRHSSASQSSFGTFFNWQFMSFYSELAPSLCMVKKRFGYKKPAFFCMMFYIWKFIQLQKGTLVVKIAASLRIF